MTSIITAQKKKSEFQVHYTDEKIQSTFIPTPKVLVLIKNVRLCVLNLIREAPKGHAAATIQQVGRTGRGHLSCFDFLTTQQAIVFQYCEIAHAPYYKICSYLSEKVAFPTDLSCYVRLIRTAARIPSWLQHIAASQAIKTSACRTYCT